MNLWDILIIVAVVSVLFLALRHMIRQKKGGASCSACGCSGCTGSCPYKAEEKSVQTGK